MARAKGEDAEKRMKEGLDMFRKAQKEAETAEDEWDLAEDELNRAKSIERHISYLTGVGGRCVVAFDFSDEDLFGESTESIQELLVRTNVKMAMVHLEVNHCPLVDLEVHHCPLVDLSREIMVAVGTLSICKPYPPGWTDDTIRDKKLHDELCDIAILARIAQDGAGTVLRYSPPGVTLGTWSAKLTWRVFYDANFGTQTSVSTISHSSVTTVAADSSAQVGASGGGGGASAGACVGPDMDE